VNISFEIVMKYIQIGIDILIVWIIINSLIKILKNNTRTIQLFQGVILIFVIQLIATRFGLTTVAWITNNIVSWGFVFFIVIFQPEIRGILERIGKGNFLVRTNSLTANEKGMLIDELIIAIGSMSDSKTGAIISIEQGVSLDDYIKTGVKLTSDIKAELLCSIFVNKTPLHDGAVIIKGDKIVCASAYFPPTNRDLPSKYGSRHRAAIGISEITDAITIVVSEESGGVTVTYEGRIYHLNEEQLRIFLNKALLNDKSDINSRDIPNNNRREMKTFTKKSFKIDDNNSNLDEKYEQAVKEDEQIESSKPIIKVVATEKKEVKDEQ